MKPASFAIWFWPFVLAIVGGALFVILMVSMIGRLTAALPH